MIVPRVEIQIYKRLLTSNSYSETPILVNEFDNISVIKGISTRKDTFTLHLFPTVNGTQAGTDSQTYLTYNTDNLINPGQTNLLNNGDRIKIYAWFGARPLNFDREALLMDGLVNKVQPTPSDKGYVAVISGQNRSELLLSMLSPAFFGGVVNDTGSMTTKKANEMVVDLITEANSYVGGDSPFAIRAALTTDSPAGSIVATDSTGSEFPDTTFTKGYRPLYQHLEDISLPSITGDSAAGPYIFEVKDDDELSWTYKSYVEQGDLIEDDYLGDKLTRSDNVINAYIVGAGILPNGADVVTFVLDSESYIKEGPKWKYLPLMDVCKTIRESEMEIGPGRNSGESIGADGLPTAYPWQMTLGSVVIDKGYQYVLTNIPITASDEDDYISILRDQAIARAQEKANETLKVSKIGKRRFERTIFPGTTDYVPGAIYVIKYPVSNVSIRLRLIEVQHRLDTRNGWSTFLKLEQDEKDFNEEALRI